MNPFLQQTLLATMLVVTTTPRFDGIMADQFTNCVVDYYQGITVCTWDTTPISGTTLTGEFATLPHSYLFVYCSIGESITSACSCRLCVNEYANCADYNDLCNNCYVLSASSYSYSIQYDCSNIYSTTPVDPPYDNSSPQPRPQSYPSPTKPPSPATKSLPPYRNVPTQAPLTNGSIAAIAAAILAFLAGGGVCIKYCSCCSGNEIQVGR